MTDDPVITIVDHRGRTVRRFRRDMTDPTGWVVAPPPRSKKSQRRGETAVARDGYDATMRHASPTGVANLDGGRSVVHLPGLTLRGERLIPILNRLAENGITRLTIDQLRECIR